MPRVFQTYGQNLLGGDIVTPKGVVTVQHPLSGTSLIFSSVPSGQVILNAALPVGDVLERQLPVIGRS